MSVVKNTRLYLSVWILMLGSFLFAQRSHPLIEYTTENGLSLNSVNDLHFDKQGFLWVTTADGLQRFDGYRFQTFKHDPLDKKSIPENSVSVVYEDQNNNLWITHRTGICCKPKGKNEFIDITSVLSSTPFRYPLTCVNETDSTVWVINDPLGIYAINKITLQTEKIFSLPDFTDQSPIYPISRMYKKGDRVWIKKRSDNDGDLFVVSDNGIKKFRNDRKVRLLFLIPDQKDSLVIITDKTVFKSTANDPFTPVRLLESRFDPSGFDNRPAFIPRKIGNAQYLLIGTKQMILYDASREDFVYFPFNEYLPAELIRYLHTATADRHQNSWLGFNGIGGIKVISLQKFNLFNRPVKNALTYTLATGREGKIFAGIYLGDIEVYDKDGRFLQKIILPEAHKKIGSPRTMAMIDSVTLIVRSTLNQLYAIDTRRGTVELLSHLLPPRPDSASSDFESGIQNIGNDEVWFSWANTVISLKKSKPGFSCTTLFTLPVKEQITSLFTNNARQVWIGTAAGLWLLVRKDSVGENNNFKKIPLPHTYIKHINQHKNGRIWATTTNGIYILQDSSVLRHLNIKDGLPNSFVYGVLFDDAENGWISTNRGLAKIDSAFVVTNYSAREGLQGDEFNTKGHTKGPDGTLYFAGVNGISFFKPNDLVNKSGPSPIMLTEIEVNNQPYLPHLQPEFVNTISLPHRQNNIRLSFSCMDFTVPEKNQFKFWLKGFQDNWSLPQKNHTVQYILPVGNYELHVLGANYEGIWNKEPLILKLNILPPWYQTNWAKAIFAFLILTLVAGVFYFISRSRYQKKLRTLQMEQQVQKEKQRLSRDLHDNLGSQITWLSNNITQLEKAEEEHLSVEKKLSQLKEGTGELMQTLRETIWILNKDKISCVELVDKVVNLAARHIEVCPPIKLQTEENIATNIELNSGQALQIFRICQEAINNACKHAQATELTIKANSANNNFSISVGDDGKGFDLNKENPGHYGLQNMKQRAEESNLQLSIDSSPGIGTTITVSVQG